MKTILVTGKDHVREIIENMLKPQGFDFIHYQNPLKALDNIEEIQPDLVFFSAEDFPRHWKPFLRLLRVFRSREDCVFILLRGETFDYDEAAKATFLGVNGVLREDLSDPSDRQTIEDLISRYTALREIRIDKRYIPRVFDDIEFVFNNPGTFHMVTGTVLDIAPESISFRPDFFPAVHEIPEGSDIDTCTLKIGDTIIPCSIHVVRNSGTMAFRFNSLDEQYRRVIVDYINSRSSRQMAGHTVPAE